MEHEILRAGPVKRVRKHIFYIAFVFTFFGCSEERNKWKWYIDIDICICSKFVRSRNYTNVYQQSLWQAVLVLHFLLWE